ncbi:MAG: hypothetical protein NTY38_17870 [Acidobacteria bacterium]|nr:hypothetical protein [Acidobacteriota bacterium]
MSEKKYKIEDVRPRLEPFLSKVFDKAGFNLTFEFSEGQAPHPEIQNPELLVQFGGRDVELLLANRGELLLAVEQLSMEALRMPSEDHEKVCFDANDYRMLRIEELRLSALTAAARVKSSHSPSRFGPMTSRERRIIHLALRNEPAVRSESSGLGPGRQVTVYPADMPSLPEYDGGRPSRPPMNSRRRR